MDPLPKYKANPAFVGLGNKPPQPFVRGDSRYAPSGPQGSRIISSERIFDLSSKVLPESQNVSSGGGGGGGTYSLLLTKQTFNICVNGVPSTVELVTDAELQEE